MFIYCNTGLYIVACQAHRALVKIGLVFYMILARIFHFKGLRPGDKDNILSENNVYLTLADSIEADCMAQSSEVTRL